MSERKYGYEGWKNKDGTQDRDAPGGSWKKYWQSQTIQEWPKICYAKECSNIATDGAQHMHYPKVGESELIIPTCNHCTVQYDATFDLKKSIPSESVNANVSKGKNRC